MKKLWFILALMVVGLVAKPSIVSSQPIKKGKLDSQNMFLGVVKFKENSQIASQSSGVVEKILFELGESVKKGENLVILNSDLLQKDIESKEAKLKQAKLLKEYQFKELERYRNLLESDSIALQQYEKLNYEFQVQDLTILSLEAELEQARVELSKKIIKAPFDGVIVKKNVNIGEWIKTGEGICEILNNSRVEAIIDVPNAILPFNKLGDSVSVNINKQNYTGKIRAIIPKADSRSRTFPVVIALPNGERLFDGMAASAMLKSGGESEGYIVPRDSVLEYRNRPSVFVIKDGRALAVSVEVLAISGGIAVVRGNLNEKDRVIYRGQYRLQDGVEVRESIGMMKQKAELA
ncbi:efflux RND transporter periplasmic adaptor subunit [Helicobacter kayseriensis]|uniref:efflux RND transporter periplasmic adaptor subunit n=1 Tax=Helicobacter kayseriensis TaxID=2905877 RepID=UPI001E4B1973|nr:efflux RND transporter periplasmic adaptor subunit [Helicobacter kayseriensis]MCE3047597.1 efflux RND transporter periplasmic adaptor subunit [Helicobacter kayseriensis]MCE3048968.1 efflux RND transporter periplasmic adaptor subunit [Helicobacter kayseriensis]